MDAWAAKRLRTFEDAERGSLLRPPRLRADRRAPLYVGRRWVHDEERRQLVVNWQAPAARPFYTATPHDPHGVTLRRRFRTDGRRLLDIADESLDGSIVDGAAVGDFLLEELERSRDTHMRDIVATIQADQYRLITRRADAAARRSRAGRAPARPRSACTAPRTSSTPTATRSHGAACSSSARTGRSWSTSRTCCPRSARTPSSSARSASSSTASSRSCRDPPAVAELKADLRLVDVIAPRRRSCGSSSEPEELVLRLEGSFVSVREREVRELLDGGAGRARADVRRARALPDEPAAPLLRGVRTRARRRARSATSTRSSRRSASGGYLDRVLKAAWPLVPPDKLVRSLLRSRAALAEAADGILDDDEQRLLLRRGTGLVGRRRRRSSTRRARCSTTPPHAYGHVIVDEAQDLTPMQLRDGRPARARRLADDPRRRRAGDGRDPLLAAGTRCCRTCRAATTPTSRSCGTPTACRARSWTLALPLLDDDRAGRRAADLLPHRRRAADDPAGRRRSTCWPRPTARPRASPQADGLLAVIVPDELVESIAVGRPLGRRAAAHAAAGEGARVRPRRRRRAGPRSRRTSRACASCTSR